MKKPLIVLHEYGAPHHFRALDHLLKTCYSHTTLVFREFSAKEAFKKLFRQKNWGALKKLPQNLLTLLQIAFSKNRLIILGIAPYDFRLVYLAKILKNHKVFYFTSWPKWDNNNYPHKRFATTKIVQNTWRYFLEKDIAGIYCVTQAALESLEKGYQLSCPRQIVFHAFDENIYSPPSIPKENRYLKCLFVGELIPRKGIEEILQLFQKLPQTQFHLTFIGAGILQKMVANAAKRQANIRLISHIHDEKMLAKHYQCSDMLLLPSKDEPFGMVIIEAMACGVVPIVGSATGPRSIIAMTKTGYLIEHGEFVKKSEKILHDLYEDRNLLAAQQAAATIAAKQFTVIALAKRWEFLLAPYLQGTDPGK